MTQSLPQKVTSSKPGTFENIAERLAKCINSFLNSHKSYKVKEIPSPWFCLL